MRMPPIDIAAGALVPSADEPAGLPLGICPGCEQNWLADPLGECACIRPGVPPEAAVAEAGKS
jgi:hypothetical protein